MGSDWKALLAQLAAKLEADFGPRCSDRSVLCATCVGWRIYDDLADLVDFVVEDDRPDLLPQGRLGAEFEAAIFSDVESLYEKETPDAPLPLSTEEGR